MRNPTTTIPACVVLVLLAAPAWSSEVRFEVSSRETFVGVPVTIQITVEGTGRHEEPEFGDVEGAEVQFRGQSKFQSTSITSLGAVTKVTTVYKYDVIPTRVGRLTIPPIVVRVDGESRETEPMVIRVLKSETGDLLFVELSGSRDSVYVGEPIDVTLDIWIKPFSNRQQQLDENDMWRCIDQQRSSWGPFIEVLQSRNREVKWRKGKRRADDGSVQSYFVYSLSRKVTPERAGTFDAGGIRIFVQYPRRVRRNRFSLLAPRYTVTEARPISASVEESSIVIKAPPLDGQPADFRGAVGKYSMAVSAAPTEVSVGDPITVTLSIRGTGRLDLLQAPPLVSQETLQADFRVPDEPLAGVVQDGVKTFSQTIRATHDGVREIPPITFSFFDPAAERYMTIQSDPIPITVSESTRMAVSQVVESEAMSGGRTQLTLLETGLHANIDDMNRLLARQTVTPGWQTWSFAAGCPLVYASCLLVTRYRDRLRQDTGFARRRSARKVVTKAIRLASDATDASVAASSVAVALTKYVADRCNLPPAGLTRPGAVERLRSCNVPEETVSRFDALLGECEGVQYAGTSVATTDHLFAEADRCVDQLERIRF